MSISFELPQDIEQRLQTNGADLNGKAREALLVELYREDAITHGQLSRALGLDSYDTDGVLKKHGVYLEISDEELRAEAAALRDVRPE
jgi:predicted HTH domain antitoxin